MRAAAIAVFLAFSGVGYLTTTSLRSMCSSAASRAPVGPEPAAHAAMPSPIEVPAPSELSARTVANTASAEDLMAHLDETMPLDEAERWKVAVELATALRVYRFEALDRCPDAIDLDRAVVRVRWSTASSADGLTFSAPEILSTVPSAWKTCALEVLREGMRITSAEIEGPLPVSQMALVLAVPVVVPSEIRERIRAAELQIAENIRAGRPPRKATPSEPAVTARPP